MKSCRPPLFWKRKFEPQVIVTCVRWYLRFCLSLRDLEELMAENRGNVSRAARAAGKNRRALTALLKKHRIDPRAFRSQ